MRITKADLSRNSCLGKMFSLPLHVRRPQYNQKSNVMPAFSAITITGVHFHYRKLIYIFLIGDSISILQEICRVLFPRGGKKKEELEKKKSRRKNFPLHLEKPEELDVYIS